MLKRSLEAYFRESGGIAKPNHYQLGFIAPAFEV